MGKRPNILLIMSDEHRADCIGSYGNTDVKTPWLDELSKQSIVFENCFCAAPVCTPSRYSLLTGMYPHQHQCYSNHSTLPPGHATIPRILRDNGYRTRAVGKMHFTPTYLDLGFEQMELAEQNGDGRFEDDYHDFLWKNNQIDQTDLMDQEREFRQTASEDYWQTFGAQTSNLSEEFHSTTWIGKTALKALDEWTESNNFLTVSFIKPHHPFDPPAPWDEMYSPSNLTILPGWTDACLPQDAIEAYFNNENLTEGNLKKVIAYYYATISQIDHWIGKLLTKLRDRGLYDDTVIIYTSDHGDYMGFHHMILKGNHMYDPLVRVPLIVKPSRNQSARRTDKLVSLVDLAPTLLSYAGCPVSPYMQGRNVTTPDSNEFVICERDRGREYMIRSHEFKLLLTQDHENSMFFDLRSDPYELSNEINNDKYRGIVAEMMHALHNTILFDSPPPVHVFEDAAEIPTENSIRQRNARNEYISWIRERFDRT